MSAVLQNALGPTLGATGGAGRSPATSGITLAAAGGAGFPGIPEPPPWLEPWLDWAKHVGFNPFGGDELDRSKYAPSHGPGSALGPHRPLPDPRHGSTPLDKKLNYFGGRGNARRVRQAARAGELEFSTEPSPTSPKAFSYPVGVVRHGDDVVWEARTGTPSFSGERRMFERLQRRDTRGERRTARRAERSRA